LNLRPSAYEYGRLFLLSLYSFQNKYLTYRRLASILLFLPCSMVLWPEKNWTMAVPTCSLCRNLAELRASHIIPRFVGKWIKETSATGYFRSAGQPNLRKQDLTKEKLLCESCEQRFSSFEGEFAAQVFRPYVERGLTPEGRANGPMTLYYKEWLLGLVISIHWRILVSELREDTSSLPPEYLAVLSEAEATWREYLLGTRRDTGPNRSYLLFLSSLAGGRGQLPPGLPKKVNFYLMRSSDGTIIWNPKQVCIYSKLGPIALVTAIKPSELRGLQGCIIRKSGEMTTVQKLSNQSILRWLYFVRPEQAFSEEISEKQEERIAQDWAKNAEAKKQSMTAWASMDDYIIRKLGKED
jgi:hypothetical protein